MASAWSSYSPYSAVPTNDRDDYLNHEVKMHRSMMEEQDADLDVLGEGIGRIGELAFGLNSEIMSQNKMLDELDVDIDSSQGNIQLITEKTKEMIKKSGGAPWFCLIISLVVILLILTFLVIET